MLAIDIGLHISRIADVADLIAIEEQDRIASTDRAMRRIEIRIGLNQEGDVLDEILPDARRIGTHEADRQDVIVIYGCILHTDDEGVAV